MWLPLFSFFSYCSKEILCWVAKQLLIWKVPPCNIHIIAVYSEDLSWLWSSGMNKWCAGGGMFSCLLSFQTVTKVLNGSNLEFFHNDELDHTVFVWIPAVWLKHLPCFVSSQWLWPTLCPALVSSTWICPSFWRPSASILLCLKNFSHNQMMDGGFRQVNAAPLSKLLTANLNKWSYFLKDRKIIYCMSLFDRVWSIFSQRLAFYLFSSSKWLYSVMILGGL